MRPSDIAVNEHVATIGPWAWMGWLLFGLTAILFGMLWRSSRAVELRELKRALAEARVVIDTLRVKELQLIGEKEDLHTKYVALHGEYLELRGKHSQLEVAFGRMGTMVSDLRKDLNDEREKRDSQYAELMRLRGKHGEL